jgi:flagellin
MGGRDQEMTFGIGRINYGALYGTGTSERTIAAATSTVDGPNKGAKFNLAHLPSDAVVAKEYGKAAETGEATSLDANSTYVLKTLDATDTNTGNAGAAKNIKDAGDIRVTGDNEAVAVGAAVALADVFKVGGGAIDISPDAHEFAKVSTDDNAFKAGDEFEIVSMGTSNGVTGTAGSDAAAILGGTSVAGGTLAIGTKFTVDAAITKEQSARLNTLVQGMTFRRSSDTLTKDIEAMQGLVNTARVQAGSQYAAIESAVNYTTDLTAQYELGYNTVNDVNFSMETAHLARNQILQQAATAMLAQANSGQQGLLQLIS